MVDEDKLVGGLTTSAITCNGVKISILPQIIETHDEWKVHEFLPIKLLSSSYAEFIVENN